MGIKTEASHKHWLNYRSFSKKGLQRVLWVNVYWLNSCKMETIWEIQECTIDTSTLLQSCLQWLSFDSPLPAHTQDGWMNIITTGQSQRCSSSSSSFSIPRFHDSSTCAVSFTLPVADWSSKSGDPQRGVCASTLVGWSFPMSNRKIPCPIEWPPSTILRDSSVLTGTRVLEALYHLPSFQCSVSAGARGDTLLPTWVDSCRNAKRHYHIDGSSQFNIIIMIPA